MSIFDKAKEKADELVDKVRDRLSHDDDDGDATEADSSADTADTDGPRTIPSDGSVTPADVAEAVSDPELPHPGPVSEE